MKKVCGRGGGGADGGGDAGAAAAAPPPQAQQPQGPDMNAYYMLGPDSQSHEGVPKGEMRGPFTLPSQAYPGHAAHLLGLRAGAVRSRRCPRA